MAPLKLYTMNESPPCRIVQMTLDLLNVKYEKIELNLFNGESRTPEYVELNPQHNVPFLIDGQLHLSESRPICTYLVCKYAKNKAQRDLYPTEDAVLKAKIDQKLYFDMGTFFSTIQEDYLGVMFKGAKGHSDSLAEKYTEVLGWVTTMVKNGYVAGTSHMTLADISFMATFSTLKALGSIDTRKYPFIEAWFQRCKQQIPHYEQVCGEGAVSFGDFYKKAKAANNH